MPPIFNVAVVSITKHLGYGLYLAEDVFDGSEIRISLTGKMRMLAIELYPKDECVIQYSSYDISRGRIITKTSLKGDQSTFKGYADVRMRYESEFGPYTEDHTLIKRAT